MHILVLPSWYPNKNNSLTGIFFKEQAEALAKQDIDVGCIAINESSPRYMFSKKKFIFDFEDKNINGINTISVLYPIPNRFKSLRSIVRQIVFKILFAKYIKKYGNPDIVHLHSFLYGELAIWIKRKYGINYIVTEHSSGFVRDLYNKKELTFAKEVFINSKYNICVSNEFKKSLEKKFSVKFDYIPNTIDTEYFVPKITQKDSFNFINIAFLNKNKNQYMLIEAFLKAFPNNKDVTLTVVGSGSEYEKLEKLTEKLNMHQQINLYGVADRKEVLKLLQNSDALILSSQYETFGVVIIEAMSCGLPVLATKCGGPESIVVDDKLGKLVDININDLSLGMLDVYSKKYDSEYIRNYVIDNFSHDVVSLKLIKIYKDKI